MFLFAPFSEQQNVNMKIILIWCFLKELSCFIAAAFVALATNNIDNAIIEKIHFNGGYIFVNFSPFKSLI